MTIFKVNLELGKPAFVVRGSLDYYVEKMTVGQVRVVRTLPGYSRYTNGGCYKEEYMCIETGIGSGNVWEYGKNIFATEEEANHAVIRHQQAAYKQRAERDKRKAEHDERKRKDDIRLLNELKEKYKDMA